MQQDGVGIFRKSVPGQPPPLLFTPNALSVPCDASPTVWALDLQKQSTGIRQWDVESEFFQLPQP